MTNSNVIIAGAAPDTANLGVNALCFSSAANLFSLDDSLNITVLDHAKDLRKNSYPILHGRSCDLLGAKYSNRFYQPSSFLNIEYTHKLPFLLSDQKRAFTQAKAILDISGGDSFTDLYGEKRFKSIGYPKKLAMVYNIPLILLPQTYGPFENDQYIQEAKRYLKYASFAFARDMYSFDYLKELLGDSFDPHKHRQAVDVAFLLPTSSEDTLKRKNILPKLNPEKEILGLNISGLIYQNPKKAKDNYKISIDYNGLVKKIVETLLKESDADIWLVPHVLAPTGHYESDSDACHHVKSCLSESLQLRVHVITGEYDQCDIKGVIRYCSWFCGTRMHATIAALSNGIPTAGLAYSGKFHGVFASVDQEDSVIDARGTNQDDIYKAVMHSWKSRKDTKTALGRSVPLVKETATQQMQVIAEFITSK